MIRAVLHGYYLENVFQSSKVFADSDGPHLEWLELHPKEAKREAGKLHNEGRRLLAFRYNATEYPLEPKTAFYDHIFYYMAVRDTLSKEDLASYDIIMYEGGFYGDGVLFIPLPHHAGTCDCLEMKIDEFDEWFHKFCESYKRSSRRVSRLHWRFD